MCVFPLFPFIIDVYYAWHLPCYISKRCYKCYTTSPCMIFLWLCVISLLVLNTYFPPTVWPLCAWFTSFFSIFLSPCLHLPIMDHFMMPCMVILALLLATLAVTHLHLATKGESLPNLDRLLPPSPPQTPVNEPVRLAPVPAWRKVKEWNCPTLISLETNR